MMLAACDWYTDARSLDGLPLEGPCALGRSPWLTPLG